MHQTLCLGCAVNGPGLGRRWQRTCYDVHTVPWEMMNVRGSNPFNVILVHMMWYKASISGENVCGSFVSSTRRDTFNVTTYDTISPLRHHEMSATCRADMSDTSPKRRIICRFGTIRRLVVRRHCQLSWCALRLKVHNSILGQQDQIIVTWHSKQLD